MKKLKRGTKRSKYQHPDDPSDPRNPFPHWVEHIHNVKTGEIDEYDQRVYERHGGRYYMNLFVYFDPKVAMYRLYHTHANIFLCYTFIQRDAFLIGQGHLDFAKPAMRARNKEEFLELVPDWVKKWGKECHKKCEYVDPNLLFLQEESGTCKSGVDLVDTILQEEVCEERGNDEGFTEH